jgi:hypothetical protein
MNLTPLAKITVYPIFLFLVITLQYLCLYNSSRHSIEYLSQILATGVVLSVIILPRREIPRQNPIKLGLAYITLYCLLPQSHRICSTIAAFQLSANLFDAITIREPNGGKRSIFEKPANPQF